MANRLSSESSPYLLQHAGNPVNWLPWGDEAFDRARREGKPVFLSVGYSSCHWCHVMAHESFEDLEVASLLNRSFVNVKVDREERPDVDEAYMTAVQLQSGRGGWPMSAFLTPEKAPFFAGTYFPKAGFLSLLRQVEAAWHGSRDSILHSANEFAEAIRSATGRPAPMARGYFDARFLEAALEAIESEFDSEHGGFGGAPKFPPHAVLAFLLKFSKSALFGESSRTRAREMALFTLEKMCCGGIHDHVGGGFHRYSTDAVWLLPHFEKMLYDNALMLDNLAHATGLATGDQAALFARAQSGIIAWLRREMRTEDGLFGAAIDADSEGEEGKFYVWEAREAREVLGGRAEEFLAAYGFAEEGNFLDEATKKRIGKNVPHVRDAHTQGFEVELQLLREARDRRARPLFDHKAIVGLNGLAVAALVGVGEHELAQEIMDRLWAAIRNGAIPRQVTNGRVSGEGFLEDYAGFFFGFSRWKPLDLERHSDLLGSWRAFADPDTGDFFSTTVAHETLFGRSKPVFDQPIPSGNALMARSLVALGSRKAARQIVEANLGWMERAPSSTAGLLLAGLEILEAAG